MYYKKNSHFFVFCPDFFILLIEDIYFFLINIHKIIIVDTTDGFNGRLVGECRQGPFLKCLLRPKKIKVNFFKFYLKKKL
jgi:hypothetical protein